jgi:hypothetical protein
MLGLGNKLTNNIYELTGGGTAYTPGETQSAKLRWWFVNNDTDNPTAGEWIGSDASSRAMDQGVSNNQPTITYTAPGYATFDGSEDFYRLDDNNDEVLVGTNKAMTAILVYKINTIDANHAIVSGGQGNSTKFTFPANDRFKITTESEQQLFVASTGTPFTTSGIKILFIARSTGGEVQLYQHGGGSLEAIPLDSTNSSNTTSNTEIKLRQISGVNNDGLDSFKGRVYEIAVWQGIKLTTTEMENLYEQYLYPRYSV